MPADATATYERDLSFLVLRITYYVLLLAMITTTFDRRR
jgi:hypothetical protein